MFGLFFIITKYSLKNILSDTKYNIKHHGITLEAQSNHEKYGGDMNDWLIYLDKIKDIEDSTIKELFNNKEYIYYNDYINLISS